MTTPMLTAIIPMHNSAATVGRAIASLREQALQDWEAIVVDDGSSDGGASIAAFEAAARGDARLRLVRQANGGVSSARNTGLDAATGKYILFLDADDWMLPGGVDALVAAAERAGSDDGGVGAAVGKFKLIGVEAGKDARERVLSVEGPWSDEISLQHLLGGIFMTTHGHIVERRYYEGLRFDPEMKLIEDTDLWFKLAERGVRWRNCHTPVGAYLLRPDSRSVKFRPMLDYSVRVYTNAFDRVGALKRSGVLAKSIDDSPERLAKLIAMAALGYSTRLAVSDDRAIDDAARLMHAAPGNKRYEARQVANSGRHAVMFALGALPDPALDPASFNWWPRLTAWWQRCEREGWLAPGGAADAAERFRTESRRAGEATPARAAAVPAVA